MTMAELAARLTAVERTVEELKKSRLPVPSKRTVEELKKSRLPVPSEQRHWWLEEAGKYADDPEYEEAMRLGREYRESLRPKERKTSKAQKVKKDAAS